MKKNKTQKFSITLIGIPVDSGHEYPYRNEITIVAKTCLDMHTELNKKFTRISNVLIRNVKEINIKPQRKAL